MNHGPDLDAEVVLPSASFTSRYRLDRSLGLGGMGEVFAATDLELHREVALKRLAEPFATDRAARRRFLREAWALARVNHPNVVAVFDVGEHDDRPALVMELVEGRSLQDLLRREGPRPPAEAASIARAIAAGLSAAHARGIVHRDVKPSNAIITPSGNVKLIDFGIAQVRDAATLTRTGQTFGSPHYMAPEQLSGDGRRVDGRADLYALGCVLFEMLAGHPPFEGDDPMAVSYRHVHEPAPRLAAVRPDVQAWLSALTDRLLAKDPNDRPASADEVVTTLTGATTGAVVPTLPPPPPTEPLPSRVERHPARGVAAWVPWAAGAVVILLVAGLALMAGGRDRAGAPAVSSRSDAASGSPSSTSPSSVTSVPGSPEAAAAALLDLTSRLQASGQIDEHTASDIGHAVDDALNRRGDEGGHGDRLDKLDELRDKLAESVDHGEVSADAAAQLDAAIRTFETTLSQD